jgi:hypothetical protein
MSTDRDLGYDIYDVIPQDEALADVADVDNGSYDAVGADSAIGDVPSSLIESGAVEMGESGVVVTADTSLDTYTPNLEEHEITHNLAFTATDKDTVAWGSGTIYVGDNAGTTYAISAGNTGNMAARTYIFLDTAVSATVLQTTTTVSGTVGPNRKLIAVAQNGVAEPQWTVYGGIGGLKLPESATSIANNNWFYSGTWSVTDADTIAWGSGTLIVSNGNSYSITASNTGNMAAKTYVYFDLAVSSTAFQYTTTASNAVGPGKILIAVCQNGTGEASYQVMNDFQKNVVAGQIVAGSITANEIAAGAITADLITVSTLSAIVADLGTITAGTITLNSSGYIKGGQTAYDTGTGFFLGYSGSAYKFSIGNASGNKMTWDGSSLVVKGTVADVQTFTSDGTWTKPSHGSIAIIEVWGAGGGGASGADDTGYPIATGGSGGAYKQVVVPLSYLSSTEAVTVGVGGTAVTGNANGNVGEASSISGITAAGGGGGIYQSDIGSTQTVAGGVGGSFGEDGGDAEVAYSSPQGAQVGGSTVYAGPGGGSASHYSANTESAGGTAALTTGTGGAGNYAASGNVTATAGTLGGGGGGALSHDAGATVTSGAGGNGQVRVTVI